MNRVTILLVRSIVDNGFMEKQFVLNKKAWLFYSIRSLFAFENLRYFLFFVSILLYGPIK